MFKTPILFLIFNRPELTNLVFKRIREIKPKYLFIAADGPRLSEESDIENCNKARSIINTIDWDCEVETLFRRENLGCKYAVSSAINWFFEQVDAGIILEDDVLPDVSFFRFCQQMLDEYECDQRIMMVTGLNICGKWQSDMQDYHFSFFGGIWGWATWKRAWKHYDVEIIKWGNPQVRRLILNYLPSTVRASRKSMYDKLYKSKIDTWDLQWTFAKLLNAGLTIIPAVNLIKNIGCTEGGTHLNSSHPWADLEVTILGVPVRINYNIISDIDYDSYHLKIEERKPINMLEKIMQRLRIQR